MGINIMLHDAGGKCIPEWDSSRYAGDREFGKLAGCLPYERRNIGSEYEPDYEFRPADFAAWRKAIAEREWPNPGRFEKLMDLMERRPDVWLTFSY